MSLSRPVELVSILSVSPAQADHEVLRQILEYSGMRWRLVTAPTLELARIIMQRNNVAVVFCERDLCPGSWRDFLEQTAFISNPPLVVVASRLADERLWLDVLHEGGYDVIRKPFDANEVIQVVESARRHWSGQHSSLAKTAASVNSPMPPSAPNFISPL